MRAAGPVVDPVPCSACGKLIDPLRAGHVAIFDQKLHYFCNRDVCRAAFLGEPVAERPPEPPLSPALSVEDAAATIEDAFAPRSPDEGLPEPPPALDGEGPLEPLSRMILHDAPGRIEPAEGRDVGALLLVLAIVAGTLAVSLSLLGTAPLTILARIVLGGVGATMLVGRALTTERDAGDPNPLPLLAAPVGAVGVALWASFGKDGALAGEATSLAGFIVTAAAVGAWLVDRARRGVAGERAWLEGHLAVPGRRAPDDDRGAELGGKKDKVFDIKPGEHVVVEAGEVVPVDLVIAEGEVEVLPWTFATTPVWRKPGDPLVAGAAVVSGRLRGVCTWAGADRAFARVVLDPRRRADAFAPVAKASRALAERWSFVAAFIGGLSAFVAGRLPVEIAMAAVAVHAALSTPVAASVAAVHVARGVLLALRRGIVYKSSDAWELAGRVQTAVFCARGTLLKGEPELGEVFATGAKLDEAEVLALAAGAERMAEDPIANAIVRAARSRAIRPDGVRNPQQYPGLGVTAISSSGEELIVGSRALLLEEHVSIAAVEREITDLEAQGRTVVLVASGGRLVGVLALIDGLRPGARAAVQHLLDAEIEPIIMSGDSRETCEAIARSLDIEHLRPEVLPAERAAEVRRVMDAGVTVAVLGHGGVDDDPLATADVAVALGAAGTSKGGGSPSGAATNAPKTAAPGDFAVTLASDDVRDASLALALARRVRTEARVGIAIAAVPALIGSVAVAFGLLPPAYAPIASLLGSAMATVHARALEGKR